MPSSDNQSKAILFAPLIFFPFLALLFWAAGGGQAAAQGKKTGDSARINASLPGASFKGKDEDKLSLYDQADRDSAKLQELRQIEARNWHLSDGRDTVLSAPVGSLSRPGVDIMGDQHTPGISSGITTPDALERRLSALQAQLAAAKSAPETPTVAATAPLLQQGDQDAAHLQEVLNRLSAKDAPDPEISQLNTLLDKVIAIQHPETLTDTTKRSSGADSVHRAIVPGSAAPVTGGFYGFSESAADTVIKNTIAAEVYQDQTISPGSSLLLMLMEDMQVAGHHIPKGTFLTGHCTISAGRVRVNIKAVIVGSAIFSVDLSAYDLDGQEGINAPNSAVRDQTKDGSTALVGDMGLTTMDPSIGAQAASAGIQTARSFLSKRIKTIKVPLYAGYRVLLKNK